MKPKKSLYRFENDRLMVTNYSLCFSSVHRKPKITLERITAVDFKTYPHSIIVDNKEVVFLNHDDKTSLPYFAEQHSLPVSTHIDSWSYLTRTFLDTELKHETIDEQNRQLALAGITEADFEKITKKIYGTLFGTMEWEYLGLWDVLAMKQFRNLFYPLSGETFYWWTMKVALQGSEYETL